MPVGNVSVSESSCMVMSWMCSLARRQLGTVCSPELRGGEQVKTNHVKDNIHVYQYINVNLDR